MLVVYTKEPATKKPADASSTDPCRSRRHPRRGGRQLPTPRRTTTGGECKLGQEERAQPRRRVATPVAPTTTVLPSIATAAGRARRRQQRRRRRLVSVCVRKRRKRRPMRRVQEAETARRKVEVEKPTRRRSRDAEREGGGGEGGDGGVAGYLEDKLDESEAKCERLEEEAKPPSSAALLRKWSMIWTSRSADRAHARRRRRHRPDHESANECRALAERSLPHSADLGKGFSAKLATRTRKCGMDKDLFDACNRRRWRNSAQHPEPGRRCILAATTIRTTLHWGMRIKVLLRRQRG